MRERGGAWVAGQIALLSAIALAGARRRSPPSPVVRSVGAATILVGGALAIVAARALGRNLTPFPAPRSQGFLTRSGPYASVRHPIYTGVWLGAVGYTLLRPSRAGATACTALAVLFHEKARWEERALTRAYPDYAAYGRAVPRRFIPFLL